MKICYCVAILLLLSKSFGQEVERKNRFPVWTFHQKNVTTNGISFGLASAKDSMNNHTNGVKIELIGLGITTGLLPHFPFRNHDENFELVIVPISEKINGISISPTGTVCNCRTNGLNIGAIGHMNEYMNGISMAVFMNIASHHNGLQLAALFNESYYMNGLQIGVSNYAFKVTGLQIGLSNRTQKLKGLQIGLWNVNQKRSLPFVNWNFGN